MAVKDARSQIIQDLQDAKIAVKVEQVQHRTPLCERSHTPIEIIPMEEFYLKQLQFGADAEEARQADEVPPADAQADTPRLDRLADHRLPHLPEEVLRDRDSRSGTARKCKTPHLPKPGKYYRPWKDPAPFRKC